MFTETPFYTGNVMGKVVGVKNCSQSEVDSWQAKQRFKYNNAIGMVCSIKKKK